MGIGQAGVGGGGGGQRRGGASREDNYRDRNVVERKTRNIDTRVNYEREKGPVCPSVKDDPYDHMGVCRVNTFRSGATTRYEGREARGWSRVVVEGEEVRESDRVGGGGGGRAMSDGWWSGGGRPLGCEGG